MNYAVIQPTMNLMGIEVEDKPSFFLELQILEDAALEAIHSKANK